MFLAFLGRWPGQLGHFRHFKTDLVLDDFEQGDVGCAEVARLGDQWPAHGARTGVELPDSAGYQVHQNVGISNFLQGFLSEFSVQIVSKVLNQAGQNSGSGVERNSKIGKFSCAAG